MTTQLFTRDDPEYRNEPPSFFELTDDEQAEAAEEWCRKADDWSDEK